jgi:hypothetical protein
MRDERTTDAAQQPDAAMSYPDRVLREAQLGATRGMDLDRLEGAVTDGCEAVAKMMAALKAADYTADRDRPVACPSCKTKFVVKTPMDPDVVARALAHATKAQDTAVRLMEFATGRPDSRPDMGSDWLRGLTDEQFAIVRGFIEANGAAAAPSSGPDRERRWPS